MKISPKFKVRSMAGQNVIIMQGKYGGDMTKIISLNDTSLFLWNTFHGKEFTAFDVIEALQKEYGIDHETAATDGQAWCSKLVECGLIENGSQEKLSDIKQ